MKISEEDRLTEVKSKACTMCPLPWKQLQVTTTGQVNPCCIWTGVPMGNLHISSFNQIWNGREFKKLRREMMEGKRPSGCQKCFLLEDIGTKSPRWYAYRKYLSTMDTIADETAGTGYDANFTIECWDIRFSNKCNLSCRMCGPEASTAWYKDSVIAFGKDYTDSVKARVNTKEVSQKLLDYLLTHLDVVTEIYFVGGEPLIMPEHYKVLDSVLENKYTDIYLRYNTNLTTLGANDKAIEYWTKLKNQGNRIEVGLSLDAIGPVAEYQRHGCQWQKVADNLKKLLEADIHIMVMPTVSVLNIWHVQDLLDYCVSLGIKGYDIANANIVTGPSHYDIRILPEKERNLTISRIKNYLEEHEDEEEELYGLRHKFFDPILTFFEEPLPNVVQARRTFISITGVLDRLREERFEDINPQYKNWKNWVQ